MPIYRFKCVVCAEHVDSFLPMRDMNNVEAWPRCEYCEVRMKRLSVPPKAPAVIYHGEGFTKALE